MEQRGQALVEFVLIFLVLFLLIGAVVDFGRAYSVQIKLAEATREGARAAAVGHFDADIVIRNSGLQGLSVSLQTTETEVVVKAECQLPLVFLGMLGSSSWQLHDQVVMRRE